MQRIEFRAMGCQMLAVIDGEGDQVHAILQQVPNWFETWEESLSRFRPRSELSQLNADSGFWIPLSDTLWAVLTAALDAARRSAGVVSPTLLDAVRATGYTRDFAAGPGIALALAPNPQPTAWAQIELDPIHRAVRLPEGLHIDLGGIAKGWAADEAARRLATYGPALVDAGGDIAVSGPMADGQPWLIGIDNPLNPDATLGMLVLARGGVATSGRDYRRWQTAEGWQHHIIDPRSGQPAQTLALTATAVAPSAREAEVAAKLLFILGEQGLAQITAWPGCAGMLLCEDGRQLTSEGWARLLAQP